MIGVPLGCEDGDPCTLDACRVGACAHEPETNDPGCAALAGPFTTALALLARTEAVDGTVSAAASKGCLAVGQASGCDLVAGARGPADRLLGLLGATRADLRTTMLALGGQLAGSSSPDAAQSATVRARLALTLLGNTPDNLRGFRATVAQGRRQHTVAPAFARARGGDAVALLRTATRLQLQLRRVIARRHFFQR